jgi:putative nucleotidyltransferase with HDIG domain
MSALPWPARVYVAVVCSTAVAAASVVAFTGTDLIALLVIGLLFAVLDPLSTVSLGRGRGVTLSASFPVSLAAVILLGPWGSALISVASVVYQPARPPMVKRLFNAAELAVSAAGAGLVYSALGGQDKLGSDDFPLVLLVVVATAGVYSAVNAGLVAGVLSLAQGVPFAHGLRTTLSTGVVGYLLYGLFGLMMAVLWSTEVGVLAAVLVLLPLLVARWAFAQYAAERDAYERTVRTLVAAVETKDLYTRGHSERVAHGAELIARRIRMTEERVELVRFAGLLHDMGKLGVPTRLLQKEGPLSPQELAIIALHPVRGVEMVREIEFLREAYDGIMHHHERVDGLGYPMGLRGAAIPEFARAIAVADAFDAMTSTRSYRPARSLDEAMAELERCRGTHFDPAMVEAFAAAVAEHGWTAAEVPAPLVTPGLPITRYDHDDPTAASAVPGSPPAPGSRAADEQAER